MSFLDLLRWFLMGFFGGLGFLVVSKIWSLLGWA